MKTLRTHPTTVVFGHVSLLKYLGRTGFHELGLTAFAVFMVPTFAWASVLLETQNGPTSPLRVITPISHIQEPRLSPSGVVNRRITPPF
jgi:hypothetical protein